MINRYTVVQEKVTFWVRQESQALTFSSTAATSGPTTDPPITDPPTTADNSVTTQSSGGTVRFDFFVGRITL
mgnify:CR=1 FL=1